MKKSGWLILIALFSAPLFGQTVQPESVSAKGHSLSSAAGTGISDIQNYDKAASSGMTAGKADCNKWLGVSLNWTDSVNWSKGQVPVQTDCVIIPSAPSKPIIPNDTNAFAHDITIEPGGGLQIYARAALFVTDFIKNNGSPEDLTVKNRGHLIQDNPNAVNSGAISAQSEFTMSDQRKQYNLVISPLTGQQIGDILGGNPRVLYHREDKNYFYDAGNGEYVPGRGLALKEPAESAVPEHDPVAEFIGLPFNGDLDYRLSYTDSGEENFEPGFNLVGNPYPSGLDLDMLYKANKTRITAEFRFWDNRTNTLFVQQGSEYNGSNYALYNAQSGTGIAAQSLPGEEREPNQYANPATAFMVRALPGADGEFLHFENSYRTNSAGQTFFGKPANETRLNRYHLTLNRVGGLQSIAAVVYSVQESADFGPEDSESAQASMELYTLNGDHQLVIDGRPDFESSDKIDLGVRIFEAGVHLISLYSSDGIFENGQNIYLKDRLTGISHNLTRKPYKFVSRTGEFNDRFQISYRPSLESQDINRDGIRILKKNGSIEIISQNSELKSVVIYSLNGNQIYRNLTVKSKKLSLPENQFKKQIAVIYVTTESGVSQTKKIFFNSGG